MPVLWQIELDHIKIELWREKQGKRIKDL